MTFHIEVPDELVGGTFAHGARTIRNGSAVVLDFIVRDDRVSTVMFRAVSRVRLDITSVQQLLSNLAAIMNDYDDEQARLATEPPPESDDGTPDPA